VPTTDHHDDASDTTALDQHDVLAGLQCVRRLWWRWHEPGAPERGPDARARVRREERQTLRAVAQDGIAPVVVGFRHQGAAREAATREALAAGAPAVADATVTGGGVRATIDLVERTGDGHRLVAVAPAAAVRELELRALAVQWHAAERAGVRVGGAVVLHLDPAARVPEAPRFVRADVGAAVAARLPALDAALAGQRAALAGPLPEVAPGPQCETPEPCPFLARCRPAVLPDLPSEAAIADAVARAPGPHAWLHAATVGPALPPWPGCRAFEPVPVLFACRTGEGEVREWIAPMDADPGEACLAALEDAAAGAVGIVSVDADADRAWLAALAERRPRLAGRAATLAARLVALPAGSAGRFALPGVDELPRLALQRDLLDAQEAHYLREALLAAAARSTLRLARLAAGPAAPPAATPAA